MQKYKKYAYLEYIQNVFVGGGGKLVLVCIRSNIKCIVVGKTRESGQ